MVAMVQVFIIRKSYKSKKKKKKKPTKINRKIEFKVQRACPLSHFPKQSTGLV